MYELDKTSSVYYASKLHQGSCDSVEFLPSAQKTAYIPFQSAFSSVSKEFVTGAKKVNLLKAKHGPNKSVDSLNLRQHYEDGLRFEKERRYSLVDQQLLPLKPKRYKVPDPKKARTVQYSPTREESRLRLGIQKKLPDDSPKFKRKSY